MTILTHIGFSTITTNKLKRQKDLENICLTVSGLLVNIHLSLSRPWLYCQNLIIKNETPKWKRVKISQIKRNQLVWCKLYLYHGRAASKKTKFDWVFKRFQCLQSIQCPHFGWEILGLWFQVFRFFSSHLALASSLHSLLTSLGFIFACIAFWFATGSADDPYVGPGNLAHSIPPLPKHKIIFQRRKLVDVQHLMGHQAQLLPILGVIVKHCLSPFQHARWWRWRIAGGNQTKKEGKHKTKTGK